MYIHKLTSYFSLILCYVDTANFKFNDFDNFINEKVNKMNFWNNIFHILTKRSDNVVDDIAKYMNDNRHISLEERENEIDIDIIGKYKEDIEKFCNIFYNEILKVLKDNEDKTKNHGTLYLFTRNGESSVCRNFYEGAYIIHAKTIHGAMYSVYNLTKNLVWKNGEEFNMFDYYYLQRPGGKYDYEVFRSIIGDMFNIDYDPKCVIDKKTVIIDAVSSIVDFYQGGRNYGCSFTLDKLDIHNVDGSVSDNYTIRCM